MEVKRGAPLTFDQQFEHKQRLGNHQGSFSVVDIKPERLLDEVPILYVPGWTEDYDTYKENLRLGYESGRRVISIKDFRDADEVTPSTFFAPGAEKRKAQIINWILEVNNLDTVDVIAHSEGAISTLIAAYYSRRFRNIVLDRPMGMVGGENILTLGVSWLGNRKKEGKMRPQDPENPISAESVVKRTQEYVKANPGLALAEVGAMTRFDGIRLMNVLGSKGVNFSIIAGVDDKMAPAGRQIKQMRKTGVGLPIGGYYSVTGTHNSISIRPETYGRLALNALNSLQYKRTHDTSEPR